MIHSAVLLLASVVGQVHGPPVYYSPPVYYAPPVYVCPAPAYAPPVYYGPPIYVSPPRRVVIGPTTHLHYHLYGMTERTREWATISYRDGSDKRVPVINGYVPRVEHIRRSDCSERFDYHYDERITYSSILAAMRDPKQGQTRLYDPKEMTKPTPLSPLSPPNRPMLQSLGPVVSPPPFTLLVPPEVISSVIELPPIAPGLRDPNNIEPPRFIVSPRYE